MIGELSTVLKQGVCYELYAWWKVEVVPRYLFSRKITVDLRAPGLRGVTLMVRSVSWSYHIIPWVRMYLVSGQQPSSRIIIAVVSYY